MMLAIAWLAAAGCAAQARSPEPVPLDRVECARCRMLVSSETGAAEIVSSSEDTRFYDDVGCLAADWNVHRGDGVAFVRLPGGGWREAQLAAYARPGDAHTAMGSGFVAFATAEDARAADRDGRALAFDDVVRAAGAAR